MIFYWKAKGTAHDNYNSGEFEAKDKAAAQEWVDKTFGLTYDDAGKQTNADLIKASLIDKAEHEKHQQIKADLVAAAEAAHEATDNGTKTPKKTA